jgi:hypothetical protein
MIFARLFVRALLVYIYISISADTYIYTHATYSYPHPDRVTFCWNAGRNA